jgi:hypothetical protein
MIAQYNKGAGFSSLLSFYYLFLTLMDTLSTLPCLSTVLQVRLKSLFRNLLFNLMTNYNNKPITRRKKEMYKEKTA